jgi:Na+-transporting NADH:ubiquinone oxidoreductase subunit NqrB
MTADLEPSAIGKPAIDPRWFQITVLGTLLSYALLILKFDLSPSYIAAIICSVLLFQTGFSYLFSVPLELKSALISGLSLCLLFRTNFLSVAILAAFFAIGGKFLIRVRGKHLFNPTNFGIVVAMLVTGNGWISPGQWGSFLFFASLTSCLGFMVVTRAKTIDLTISFLLFYVGLLFYRASYLGDPWAIPLHQLESGALIIFSFFMISDPRTTPNTRIGRILFSLLTALIAYYFRFKLFNPNGLVYALVLSSLMVPVIDLIFKGPIYNWPGSAGGVRKQGLRERGRTGLGALMPSSA